MLKPEQLCSGEQIQRLDPLTETVGFEQASLSLGVRRVMRTCFTAGSIGLGLPITLVMLWSDWRQAHLVMFWMFVVTTLSSLTLGIVAAPFLVALRNRSLPISMVAGSGTIVYRAGSVETEHELRDCAWYIGNVLDAPVSGLLPNARPLFVVDDRSRRLLVCGTSPDAAAMWLAFFRSSQMLQRPSRTAGRLMARGACAAACGLALGCVAGLLVGWLAKSLTGDQAYGLGVWGAVSLWGLSVGVTWEFCYDLQRAITDDERKQVYLSLCGSGGFLGFMCSWGAGVPILSCTVIAALLIAAGLVAAFKMTQWTDSRLVCWRSGRRGAGATAANS